MHKLHANKKILKKYTSCVQSEKSTKRYIQVVCTVKINKKINGQVTWKRKKYKRNTQVVYKVKNQPKDMHKLCTKNKSAKRNPQVLCKVTYHRKILKRKAQIVQKKK